MALNTTSFEDKHLKTDFVDFGKHKNNRFGRISWSKNEKTEKSKYLEIQVKVFKMDQQGDFRVYQNLNMGESDFNEFLRMMNDLVVAATEFGKEQDLEPLPAYTYGSIKTNRTFSRDMETQLKMVHKVWNVVDLPHRKICVTMLRYTVEDPESSYVQIRLFGKQQKDGNFQQIVYVR